MSTRTIRLRLTGRGQRPVDAQLVIRFGAVEVWTGHHMLAAVNGEQLLTWLDSPAGTCPGAPGVAFVASGQAVCLYIRELVPAQRLSTAAVNVLRESLRTPA